MLGSRLQIDTPTRTTVRSGLLRGILARNVMKNLRTKLLAAALATAALATTGGVLIAAPGDKPAASDKKADPNAPAPLSMTQLRNDIETFGPQAKADGTAVVRLQIAARKTKDIIKLNCVNDKLVQVKGLLNLIDDDKASFTAARQEDDLAACGDARANLVKRVGEVRRLKEEAMACLGDELSHISDGDVDVDGPDMPDDPTDDGYVNPLEPPAYVTPWN